MDAVFRALADPTRRKLLDELFAEDGQTLTALEKRLPMTRFGVMKHLRVLEEANLVTTRRRGREKLHFLNPVPIRLVHDRWVSKYAEPWAVTLSGLKKSIEEEAMQKLPEAGFQLPEGPLRPEDPAGDGRGPDDAGFPALLGRGGGGLSRVGPRQSRGGGMCRQAAEPPL